MRFKYNPIKNTLEHDEYQTYRNDYVDVDYHTPKVDDVSNQTKNLMSQFLENLMHSNKSERFYDVLLCASFNQPLKNFQNYNLMQKKLILATLFNNLKFDGSIQSIFDKIDGNKDDIVFKYNALINKDERYNIEVDLGLYLFSLVMHQTPTYKNILFQQQQFSLNNYQQEVSVYNYNEAQTLFKTFIKRLGFYDKYKYQNYTDASSLMIYYLNSKKTNQFFFADNLGDETVFVLTPGNDGYNGVLDQTYQQFKNTILKPFINKHMKDLYYKMDLDLKQQGINLVIKHLNMNKQKENEMEY